MSVSQLNPSTSSGKTLYVQKFTSSGTFTLPAGYGASNPLLVEAFLVGAGGGAAGNCYYSATPTVLWGGGGGGGGVVQDILSLTADTAITVGKGGAWGFDANSWNGNGGNGSFSAVGASAKNLFINPQCLVQQTYLGMAFPWASVANISVTNSSGAIRGGYFQIQASSPAYSQPYRLTPGTTYTLSHYAQPFSTNGTGVQIVASFFSSTASKTNTAISSSTSASQSIVINVWTRVSHTFTMPAGADIVVFTIQPTGTAQQVLLSNFQLEAGSSATTYVDGDSAGYAWVGPRDGSETVLSGTYLAVAGGGGGGVTRSVGIQPNNNYYNGGLPGATSGGGTNYPGSPTSITLACGGHGGGAAGAARPFWYINNSSPLAANPGVPSAQAPFGVGSVGFYTTTSTTGNVTDRGMPGPGVGEYGRGGFGAYYQGGNGVAPTDTWVKANSGQGGSGVATGSTFTNAVFTFGNLGADGCVILRYWA